MSVMVEGTPVQIESDSGMRVKREDLCCSDDRAPKFSKLRGVMAHMAAKKREGFTCFAALDTYHSQAGHAVAFAAAVLGGGSLTFWPARKADGFKDQDTPICRPPQFAAERLGSVCWALQAGRSAILYHRAKKILDDIRPTHYLFPNGLKLEESVLETAVEVARTDLSGISRVVVPASSATITAGVWRGLGDVGWRGELVVHLGYSRSQVAVRRHIEKLSGRKLDDNVLVIDEGYSYSDEARAGNNPDWPCNRYYDLKTYRWMRGAYVNLNSTLLWNVG